MYDYICNQRDIPKEQWRYGLRSSAATGCGWIAVYNALLHMGCPAAPEHLIPCFEKNIPILNGNTGTVLFTPAALLRKWGFIVKAHLRREDFDQAAREADVCILFYRWVRKYKYGAHFICLHPSEAGFTGYNVYRTSKGPDALGESLSGFLARRKYFGAVLFTVKKPQ